MYYESIYNFMANVDGATPFGGFDTVFGLAGDCESTEWDDVGDVDADAQFEKQSGETRTFIGS